MNQFQSVIETMLGWLRGVVQSLWDLFSGKGSGGTAGWFAANWKGLLFFLCLFGVLVDLVVYVLRWKPYRVWNSFFRRRAEHAVAREAGDDGFGEAYPDPETAPDEDEYGIPPEVALEEENERRRRDARSNARAEGLITGIGADGSEVTHLVYEAPVPAMDEADAYSEPYIPPQWRDPGDVGATAPRRRRYQPDERT